MLRTFEEWVDWVFNHPVVEPEWYWQDDSRQSKGSAVQIVEFLTRLFRDPLTYLKSYSDGQISQGLWFLVDCSCSDHTEKLLDETVSAELRRRCLYTVPTLFRNLFAERCSPHLSSLTEPGSSPLNGVCYMWWDLLRFAEGPGTGQRLDAEESCLAAMRVILSLPNVACQESALHGLGHWHAGFPDQTRKIIDDFLSGNPSIDSRFRNYAFKAMDGDIL